ncbi:proprotein convertase subtilisin/kexin type 5-like [Bolinopsis microptera]|uniref:proprotein convertase subtilisin/kexin type 5-like n=1 Tax=Bolinopsis microptera TaxID=2820187 RepID=UPI003079EF7A
MRSLALCLLLILQASGDRTSVDDILDLADGDDCPKGTWSVDGTHFEGADECEQCYEGEFANMEGSVACDMCPAGTYTPEMGFWECLNCPAGEITMESGNYACFPCGKGKHSPVEGGTVCEECLPGHFQDEEGAAGCKVCSAGQYQDVAASTDCKLCPAGTSSPAQSGAVTACVDCPAGSYSPVDGSECLLCPVLKYRDAAGATACKDCPSNSDKEGATDCLLICPEGQVPVDGVCEACDAGSFALLGADSCTKCSKGYYSNISGAASCSICPVKTYGAEEGMTACLPCDGNDAEGMTECKIVCPAGQIVKDGKCEACAAGQYETEGQCLPCAAGSFSDQAGSVSCDLCVAGHYSAEGASQCSECSAGQYQDKTGQANCEDCSAGYYGPAAAAASCVKCAAGFFNSQQGQAACQECPAGTITEIEGQLSCQECDAGSYSISSSQCELCPAGQFSDDKAAVCSLCAAGSYTPYEGSSGCMPAPAGKYVDSEGAVDAKVCPAGSYCEEGSVAPTDCPAGSICGEGSSSGTPCPIGTYNPNAGSVSLDECVVCPAGKYCDQAGLVAPSGLCSAGYYCPAGSESDQEEISPAGHYCPDGSAEPTPCPRSTYNELAGAVSADGCIACPEGKETAQKAATSADQCKDINCVPGYFRDPDQGCQICPKGTFSNIANAVACRSCPRHQYNSVEGAVQCMQCPDTAFTWSERTDSLDGCIGPVIEVCTGEDMTGNCYRYYDNEMLVNVTVKSVKVISGEFDLFDLSNKWGYYTKLAERHGAHNVNQLGRLSNVGSFVALINDVFCSLDQGWKYHGSIRKTSKSGKACINWKRTPLAGRAAPNHFCQNPNGNHLAAKPFCYISETETEECDIPSCIWDMDCFTGNGVQYRGKVGDTISGHVCQNWNTDYPVIHSYHSPEYNWAGVGEHTKCRNPSPESEGRPWCFKDYFWSWFEIWDYCDIPACSRAKFDFYRF